MSILDRLASGEPGALESCMQRYRGLVWSLANNYSNSRSDAEDAVQEIFLDLWRHAGRYRSEIASEVTFISTLARRPLIDRYRYRGRRPSLEPFPETLAVPDPRADGAAERTVELERVGDALERLRPERRRALRLALFEGLTHAEIAAVTDTPLGTVKTLIRRGLIELRESLEAPAPPPAAPRGGVAAPA